MNETTKPPCIAYIDDREELLNAVQCILDTAGYAVTTFMEQADIPIEELLPFDLLIMDMIWPEMANMDRCMELIRNGFSGKIIIASTRNLPIEEWDLFDGLGFKLIMKPFGPRELLQRVRHTLLS